MCGITGIIYADTERKVDQRLLEQMNNEIIHRGPDDYGYYNEMNVGLGFRRLSIIDLNSGHQPMQDSTGRLTIVFNGEIYNYIELKAGLKQMGFNFLTTSDTEVILNLYLSEGTAGIKKLRGMFAFVIFDKMESKIVAVRDRFGIKPFYYYLNHNTFIFGSELKSITQAENLDLNIDNHAIESFFSYGYILGQQSIYREIKKLKPANILEIKFGDKLFEVTVSKYWTPAYSPVHLKSEHEIADYVRDALLDSVSKHLISDVPVGAFLSGGIDSSAVVALICKLGHSRPDTFSIGFKEAKFNELPFARAVADRYNTNHHELIVEPTSASLIDRVINNFDEPFADSSAIPTYIVSNLASQYVKVVLSGDGGDELFAGYDTYKRLRQIQKVGNIPGFIRNPLFRTISNVLPAKLMGKRFSYYLSKNPEYSYAYFAHVYENEKKNFYSSDFYQKIKNNPIEEEKIRIIKDSQAPDLISKMMELDVLTYMPDDILTKVDRASMLNSIEVRVPFIDHVFAEKMFGIPSSLKLRGKEGKYILKRALQNDLPPEVLSHKKQGFTIPFNAWFKDDLREYVGDALSNTSLLEEFISKKYLNNIKDTSKAGSLITRIFPILVLSLWLNKNKHIS
jgi:asparagine synthase (glutamine-hydrolysing)